MPPGGRPDLRHWQPRHARRAAWGSAGTPGATHNVRGWRSHQACCGARDVAAYKKGSRRYARAREAQAAALFDEMLEKAATALVAERVSRKATCAAPTLL